MAGEQQTMTFVIDAQMKVDKVQSSIKQIQNSLSGLKMPANLEGNFKKSFSNLDVLFTKYKAQIEKGFETKGDVSALAKTGRQIDAEINRLNKDIAQLTGKEISFKIDTQQLIDARKKLEELQNSLIDATKKLKDVKIGDKTDVSGILQSFQEVTKGTKASGKVGEAITLLNEGDAKNAVALLQEVESSLKRFKQERQDAFEEKTGMGMKTALDAVIKTLEDGGVDVQKFKQLISETSGEIEKIQAGRVEQLGQTISEIADQGTNVQASMGGARVEIEGTADATVKLKNQMDDLKRSTEYFFGLRNMLRLLKRGFKEAVDVIKELDAVMTETAVVTNYSVGDMWNMLPEYTDNANALGATVKDMYEATTLYYQQGLNSAQALGLANETLKMARISGLEAADATDAMTAALRGFNMEINETSALRINDVYSELAARSASNVEELSTAMEKTASLAHSAGMSFEGTSAFLAQMIETTREAPENLGTAMKTIIARFQEMKKNPLEIVDVEGEEVSYNKVDEALQSIGVSLKDANGQFRALDEVFLEISQKWDTLSQTQQRYIATTAAGSRQQSRFIAMMSNYSRTVELMGYANDSAGASEQQFGKTLESLEAKLNKLKNAWNAFLMGITNNTFVKFLVDGLTTGVTAINKLIDTLSFGSGAIKSFLSLFVAFKGLKFVGNLVNFGIGRLGGFLGTGKMGSVDGEGNPVAGRTNPAQAAEINRPIVQKLAELIGIERAKTGQGTDANGQKNVVDHNTYARAQARITDFRQGGDNRGNFTSKDLINAQSGLSEKELKVLMTNNPDIGRGIEQALKNKNIEVSAEDLRLVSKGQISYQNFADKYGIREGDGTFSEQMEKLQKAGRDFDAAGLVEEFNKKLNIELEKAGVDANSEKGRKIINNLDKSYQGLGDIGLEKTDKIVAGLQRAGSATTSFGMSIQSLGAQISQVNPMLGGLISRFGSLITTLGSGITGIGSMMSFIGGPATIGIAAAIAALGYLTYQEKQRTQAIIDEGKAVSDNYKKVRDETTQNINNLKEWRNEFAVLSKGVDANGNNVNLSTDQYARYLEIVNGIAEINPSIVEGYNAQGQAIITNNKALEETLRLEQERAKINQEEYTSIVSLNKLILARNEDDNYRQNIGYSYSSGSAERVPLLKSALKFTSALSKSDFYKTYNDEIDKILSDYGIEQLENWGNKEVSAFSENYDDILRRFQQIVERNPNGPEVGKSIIDSITTFETDRAAFREAVQPMYDWMSQTMSQQTGYESIPPELKTALQKQFQRIVDTSKDAEEMESRGKKAVEQLVEMTTASGEFGEEYERAMKMAETAQDDYSKTLDETAYKNNKNVRESAGMLHKLANEAKNASEEYGDAMWVMAEFYENQAARIEKFADGADIDLSIALNTMQPQLTSAEGALERFSAATEKDFSTAAEGMKSIYDEVFKETEDKLLNLEGKGSQTFWAGARELLGTDLIKDMDIDTAVSMMKTLEPMFTEGQEGFDAFYWHVVNNYDKLKDILGEESFDENGFFTKVPDDKWHEVAMALGMSDDMLTSMINKGRQFADIDFMNVDDVRKALATNNMGVVGTQSTNGNQDYFVREETLIQNLRDAGYYEADIPAALERLRSEGIKTIPEATELESSIKEAKEGFENYGSVQDFFKTELDIKSTQGLIEKLVATGNYTKDEIQDFAKKANFDDLQNAEDFEKAYKDALANFEDPVGKEQLDKLSSIEKILAEALGVDLEESVEEGVVNGLEESNEENKPETPYDKTVKEWEEKAGARLKRQEQGRETLANKNQLKTPSNAYTDTGTGSKSGTKTRNETTTVTTEEKHVSTTVDGTTTDGAEAARKYIEDINAADGETVETNVNAALTGDTEEIEALTNEDKVSNISINAIDNASNVADNVVNKLGRIGSVTAKINADASGFNAVAQNVASKIAYLIAQIAKIKFPGAALGQNQPRYSNSIPSAGSAAKGTGGRVGPKGRGGLTLTGEEGYEIAWLPNENRSVILGAGGPQMVDLPANAVVWTHKESEDILKRRGIDAGSLKGGATISYTPKYPKGGSSKSTKKSSKSSSKSSSDNTTNVTVNFSMEEVKRYNLEKRIDYISDSIDNRSKAIEKLLNRIGTRTSDINKKVADQIKELSSVQKYNKDLVASYQTSLKNLDTGNYREKISWNSGGKSNKEETVNLSNYIKNNNGQYEVDFYAIGGIGDAAKREAVFKAAQSALDSLVSGLANAKKAVTDTEDKIDEVKQQLTDTFYAWENELTRVYNATQRLENATSYQERFGEEIAKQMAKVTAGTTTLGKALSKLGAINQRNSISIKDQIKAQKELILAQQQRLARELSSADELAEYNRVKKDPNSKNTNNLQVAKATLDASKLALGYLKNIIKYADGTYTYDINYAQIEKDKQSGKLTEETYKAIYDKIEEINQAQADTNSAIKDGTNTITELNNQLEEYRDFVVSIEDELLKGYEEQIKTEIDNNKRLSDTISKALKDLLDKVKKILDLRRKQEDNLKTEDDISKKQQRLAMLQADTSGNHAVEIAQLQKEIGDARQNYQRTLEDQMLERLQTQADEAQKQRERQIELAQAQLDVAIATGVNINTVKTWLQNPSKYQSEITNALAEVRAVDEKGYYGQQQAYDKIEADILELANSIYQLSSGSNSLKTIVNNQNKDKNSLDNLTTTLNTATKQTNVTAAVQKSGNVATKKTTTTTSKTSTTATAANKAAEQAKAKAAAQKEYNQRLKERGTDKKHKYYGQLGKDALKRQIAVGKTAGISEMKVLQDFVDSEGLTWYKVMKAYVDLKGRKTAAENLKKYFGSNPSSPRKTNWKKVFGKTYPAYKDGGIADFTGPAWLDGTKSKPELILDSADTKNFIALRDVLSSAMRSINSKDDYPSETGDINYEININVDHLNNDYDVDKVAERVKKIIVKDSTYRNTTSVRKFR